MIDGQFPGNAQSRGFKAKQDLCRIERVLLPLPEAPEWGPE